MTVVNTIIKEKTNMIGNHLSEPLPILLEEDIKKEEITLLKARLRLSVEKLININLTSSTFVNIHQQTNSSICETTPSEVNLINKQKSSLHLLNARSNVLQIRSNNINVENKDITITNILHNLAKKYVR